ncbi:hypothetical protein PRIC2_014489 [Phytophthora ramorum]
MASQSNSSTSEDVGDSTVAKTTSSNAGDSCTWYAGENCSQPRSGFDCLNVLLDTDECAIDPNGACVSMSVYAQYLSDREYYQPLSKYFPASDYSYCSTNDSVCATCISEWTTNYEATGTAGSTTYCTGSSGCVCVAAVEVPEWQQTVVAYQCGSASDSDSSSEFSSGTRTCIILAMCVCGCLLLAVFVVRRYMRVAGPRNFGEFLSEWTNAANGELIIVCSMIAGPGSIPHPPPSGPQLSLAGWKSLREKLIETEHGFVRGDTARLDATVRSAESMTDASTVTVQVAPAPSRQTPSPASFEPRYMMAPM